MIARSLTVVLTASALMGGCSIMPGHGGVQSDWSCRAVGVSACHSISHNEAVQTQSLAGASYIGSPINPGGSTAGDRPAYYGRHVLRVTIAPWIDDDGRYHAASTIFAPTGRAVWGAAHTAPQ